MSDSWGRLRDMLNDPVMRMNREAFGNKTILTNDCGGFAMLILISYLFQKLQHCHPLIWVQGWVATISWPHIKANCLVSKRVWNDFAIQCLSGNNLFFWRFRIGKVIRGGRSLKSFLSRPCLRLGGFLFWSNMFSKFDFLISWAINNSLKGMQIYSFED